MLSFRENIPVILKAVEDLQPMKILDVGAGMGKYGLMIREQYLSTKAEHGQLEPIDDIQIDAVEDTKYLLTDRLRKIYNTTFEMDVFQAEKLFDRDYDVVLFIDTVEHWDKEKTLALLRKVAAKSAVIISTPSVVGMYTEHFYGDSRHHITQWEIVDFADNFKEIKVLDSPMSHIVVIPKQ